MIWSKASMSLSSLCGVGLDIDEERVLFIGGKAPNYSLSLCANIEQLRSNDPPRRAWDKIMHPGSGPK